MMGRLGNNLFQYAFLFSLQRLGVIPDVYLQSERYFPNVAAELKAMLQEGITKIDKVAIHVRRGDYVGNPFYAPLLRDKEHYTLQSPEDTFLEPSYYEKAMEEFPDAEFLVFSDDIEWCKQHPLFKDCEFSEGLSEEDDLNRMASCIGHIIANSSFSWWAAWLSPHGGKVIAPKDWYSDGVTRTELPAHWKQI